MPDQVTNYKCPSCGGPLHFDPDSQKLLCDFCGSTFTTEEISKIYADANAAAAAAGTDLSESNDTVQWSEEEAAHMRAYSCPSCGAQLICDENTAATSCPYCGNPTVVPAQFDGALRPDYIIPFRLKKEEAVRKLSEFYKGKPLLPTAFKNNNHIEEIKGVYVPFWLYDGDAATDLAYHATRVHSHSSGDYLVTVTEHYQVERQGTVRFRMVPADASSKMPDEMMDAIEPFRYDDLIPFDMSYLPGYLADKYDVSAEEDADRADVRMKNSAIEAVSGTVGGYASCVPEKEHVHIIPDRVHYAFLPVWMLSTRWNNQIYLFAMNGQTGKFIGDLPVDMGKFWLYFIVITVVLMAALALVLFVLI
jgi:uncharacterized Zn finger protein (UPF0148 family)